MSCVSFDPDALAQFVEGYSNPNLRAREVEFLRRVYADGIGKYTHRLRRLGFASLGEVLDLGCGFGQWSLALAALNNATCSLDVSEGRIAFLRDVAAKLRIRDVEARTGSTGGLPWGDGTFDGVFCYGVLPVVDWRLTMREIARVLKPGGIAYMNANDVGWYLFLWDTKHNKTPDYDPRERVRIAFQRSREYDREGRFLEGGELITSREDLRRAAEELGLRTMDQGLEGSIGSSRGDDSGFLIGEYGGLVAVHEILVTKKELDRGPDRVARHPQKSCLS